MSHTLTNLTGFGPSGRPRQALDELKASTTYRTLLIPDIINQIQIVLTTKLLSILASSVLITNCIRDFTSGYAIQHDFFPPPSPA